MDHKKLGKTGVDIPEMGLGTWAYNGGVVPLRKGISLGAFLIDTAEAYGTEGVVGDAIEKNAARGVHRHKGVTITFPAR